MPTTSALRHARAAELVEHARADDVALVGALHCAQQFAGGDIGGDEEGEVARDRLQRRRSVRRPGEASALPSGNGIEEQLDRDRRDIDIERLERLRMQRAEPRQHRLGPKPQGARLARVEPRPGLAHHLQLVDRRAGLGKQRQRLGLGVERVELIPVQAKVFVHGTSYFDDSDYGGYYVDDCLTTQFIVATAPGYTIERVPCETGRREYGITLYPLLSDMSTDYTWASAGSGTTGCSGCHANGGDRNEFNEWQQDGHSTVLRDSYFWPLYMGMDVNKNPGIPTQWKIISSGEKVREINPSLIVPV